MTTAIQPSEVEPQPRESNILVVAEHPSELEAAQKGLVKWADDRLALLQSRRSVAEADVAMAKKSKWRASPFQRVVSQLDNEIEYVAKLHMAMSEGYCIVPNFPVQIIAIRVGEDAGPPGGTSTSTYGHRSTDSFEISADALPSGEGVYVDPFPKRRIWTEAGKDDKGNAITKYKAEAAKFRDVAFPVHMAKPRVLDATQRAMALKCFDRIGVLPGSRRKQDPLVIGQIFRPNTSLWQKGNGQHGAVVSFLIAWWIDTRDL